MKYEMFDAALVDCGYPISCFEKEKKISVPNFVKQYGFKYQNKIYWRPDYVWAQYMLIVEIEGGAFVNGGHVRGAGFRRDMLKYNTFTEMGYTVMRFMPEHLPIKTKKKIYNVKRQYALDCIRRYFENYHD